MGTRRWSLLDISPKTSQQHVASFYQPASLLWLFSSLHHSSHSSVCSWSFILSSCPFLMLVPKSGKAKGMKRPPYTSPTPPISALSLPWHPRTPVTISTMTLWSSVIHIYCVWQLTWWFWPDFFMFCVLWLTCVIFMSRFLAFSWNQFCCVPCL